nr:T9SS type A sorting domain-containing protein [Bacteroidota bacterium]
MVANLFSELIAQDELVILQNFTSVCWPSAGVNTIDLTGGWDTYSGYQVKVVEDQQVTIDGTVLTDRTFTCDNAGWYLIPVLNDCGASVEALFGEVLNDVIVVKEVAGTRVYWPGYVQTLTFLEPGRSYIAKFSDAVSFTYPECTDATAPAGNSMETFSPEYWDMVPATSNSHLICFYTNALAGLPQGSELGAFTTDGLCVGATPINQIGEPLVLVSYPNDETTPEKDGFTNGEPLAFKVFFPDSGHEETLEVITYNQNMPDASGNYAINGISGINEIQAVSAIHENADEISIFPNPTSGELQIKGLPEDVKEIIILDLVGNIIFEISNFQKDENIILDLSGLPKGIYVLNLKSTSTSITKKIVLK